MWSPLDQWIEHSVAQKHGALPQHTQILKALVEDNIKSDDAAKQLIDDTSSSRDVTDVAYRLWNLLFHTAANLPSHINTIVNLILDIYNVPPVLKPLMHSPTICGPTGKLYTATTTPIEPWHLLPLPITLLTHNDG
ncbi:hypothetical protein KCU83_g8171, partial [Aureobasidium melanogenum]